MGPDRGGGLVLLAVLPKGRGSSSRLAPPGLTGFFPIRRSERGSERACKGAASGPFSDYPERGLRDCAPRRAAPSMRGGCVPAASELAWGCRPPPAGPSGSPGPAELIGELMELFIHTSHVLPQEPEVTSSS
ncbi:uncharacterized protein LOC108590761 [Callithrix jacchus]